MLQPYLYKAAHLITLCKHSQMHAQMFTTAPRDINFISVTLLFNAEAGVYTSTERSLCDYIP